VYGATPNTLTNLTLGGLFRLSGLKTDQLRGTEVLFGRFLYSYRLTRLPSILGGSVYAGASAEAGNVWTVGQTASLSDLRYSGSVYFGADTFAGPFYLAYGRSTGGAYSFYMYLGRPF
jgi:NTE family protein